MSEDVNYHLFASDVTRALYDPASDRAVIELFVEGDEQRGPVRVMLLPSALPKLSALALHCMAERSLAKAQNPDRAGFAVDDVSVRDGGGGWTVLEFRTGPSAIPVVLDSAQIRELRAHLERVP